MHRVYSRMRLVVMIVVWFILVVGDMRVPTFGQPVIPGLFEPPRITPPPIAEVRIKGQEEKQQSFLKSGFHALFPIFDGEAFYVSTKMAGVTAATPLPTAKKVFDQTVLPFLASIGFRDPATRFRIPRHRGVEKPAADPKALADVLCRQPRITKQKRTRQICDVLSEKERATPEFDAAIRGLIGMTSEEFADALRRVEIEYFFAQIHRSVPGKCRIVKKVPTCIPLEHAGIRAAGWKGQAISSVSGRVLNDYDIDNKIKLTPEAAVRAGRSALQKVKGLCCADEKPASPPVLFLLPYGQTRGPNPRPVLKYVYRMAFMAKFRGSKGAFYTWVDADRGEIRQLVPRIGSATAQGYTFIQDPASLPAIQDSEFEIDGPNANGKYQLKRSGVFDRVDRLADRDYDDGEAERTSPDFTTNPPPGVRDVACKSGGNKEFQEIDLMATITKYESLFNASPRLSSFPRQQRIIQYEHRGFLSGPNCYAAHTGEGFIFGVCAGYDNPLCPDVPDEHLNPAHDHTVVAHEVGHAFTGIQYKYPDDPIQNPPASGDRLTNWCIGPTLEDRPRPAGTQVDPCPKPTDLYMFHDFADAWVQVLENTNCFGGWVARNRGVSGNSEHCNASHSEAGDWPRRSEVAMAFTPSSPPTQDHFPEHRLHSDIKFAEDMPYSDMQIAAAALWAVRQGLISLEPLTGEMLFLTRFVRTLETTGWVGQFSTATLQNGVQGYIDRDVYRALVELEVKLANHWAGSLVAGESTINKVTAGFARAGIFMIPWACIDGDVTTEVYSYCMRANPGDPPAGESGADAVIDVDSGSEQVARDGNPPTFHIWTGPLYQFDRTGTASNFQPSAATTSPCNTEYEVEIADNPGFTGSRTSTTGGVWRTVSNTLPRWCYDTWQPSAADWDAVTGTTGDTHVYYHVRTRKGVGIQDRISTDPANGLFGSFEPPSILVRDSGAPEVDRTPPSPPTNLSATATSFSEIILSWSASSDNVGVTGYKVFRNGAEIGTVTGTSYRDAGLSAATGYVYTVQAFDAAGNTSAQSSSASATTLASPSGGGTEFQAKCTAPGVINCFGVDDTASLFYNWPRGTVCDAALTGHPNGWNSFLPNRSGPGNAIAVIDNGRCNYPEIDTTLKHSGEGSLKFTIPSNSGTGSGGFYGEPFKRLSGGTFAYISPGSSLANVLYFQFYQRFDQNFLNTDYQCTNGQCIGWLQMSWYGNPPTGLTSGPLFLALYNGLERGVPQMYGQEGPDHFGIQDAAGCLVAGSGYASRANYPEPPCVRYKPNQWMEFTGRIEIRGPSDAPQSRVQLWVDGKLVIDYGQAKICWACGTGNGFGSFMATPLVPNKDPNQVNPTAYTWIDDIIVSTQPIAMATTNSGGTTPSSAPANIRVQ